MQGQQLDAQPGEAGPHEGDASLQQLDQDQLLQSSMGLAPLNTAADGSQGSGDQDDKTGRFKPIDIERLSPK